MLTLQLKRFDFDYTTMRRIKASRPRLTETTHPCPPTAGRQALLVVAHKGG